MGCGACGNMRSKEIAAASGSVINKDESSLKARENELDMQRIEEAEKKRKEEAESNRREEVERRGREEGERKGRLEAERKGREEAERKTKEEAERKKREEEAERKRREEAERKKREETERKKREEAEKKRREEAEREEVQPMKKSSTVVPVGRTVLNLTIEAERDEVQPMKRLPTVVPYERIVFILTEPLIRLTTVASSGEAERKRREEEAERKRREDAERKRREEEAERKRREDAERKRREDAERKRREEEAERKRREEDRALAEKTSIEIQSFQDIRNILLSMPKMINLQRLTLNHCKIDDNLAILLADSMKNCKLITYFDIQYNCIREKGFKALIPRMRLLKLGTAYFQGQVRESGKDVGNRMSVGNVRELLKLPPSIDTMSSEMARFDRVTIGIQIYPKVGLLSIQNMCLSEQNLGDAGAKIVSNSFSIMVNMRTLYFYKNAVGEEGASVIARQLPNVPVLDYLSLSQNHIPPEYIRKFDMMNTLREAAGLSHVDVNLSNQYLSSNDKEAEEMARAIPGMENGREIDFYSQSKKFTSYGKGLIEAANESRKTFDLKPLTITF